MGRNRLRLLASRPQIAAARGCDPPPRLAAHPACARRPAASAQTSLRALGIEIAFCRRRKEPCPPAVFAQSNCFSCDAAKTEKPKSTGATANRNPPAGRSRNQSDIVWKLSDDECSDALAVT